MFKILTGREDLPPEHSFEAIKSSSTRGHECKLYRKATGTLKNNYLSKIVVNLWNKLNEGTIYSDSVELFKIRLSKSDYQPQNQKIPTKMLPPPHNFGKHVAPPTLLDISIHGCRLAEWAGHSFSNLEGKKSHLVIWCQALPRIKTFISTIIPQPLRQPKT